MSRSTTLLKSYSSSTAARVRPKGDREGKSREKEKLPAPTNEIMVDWIAYAWNVMCCKATTVVKVPSLSQEFQHEWYMYMGRATIIEMMT